MRVLRRGIESSCDSIYILGVDDALLVRYTLEDHSVLLETELTEEFLLLGVVLVALVGLLSEELHEVRRVHEHLRVLYTQYLLEEGLCLLVAAYVCALEVLI